MQQLTPGIHINTSQLWQTNTGIIHGPQGAVLVDPGIFEPEFEAISRLAGPVAAGFCTHAHWDHVLWHRLLGDDIPRYATPETIAIIGRDRERILRNLAETEAEIHQRGESDGSKLWDRTQLFKEQPVQWGPGTIAGLPVEVIAVPGHEDGQAALLLPDHGVAFVADTLSDIETPSVSSGVRSVALYLQTLDRLQSIIDRVEWIVPGHGKPANHTEAQRRLDADRRYLEALVPMVNAAAAGEGAEDVATRILRELGEERAESGLSWEMHLDNVKQLLSERNLMESGLPVRRSSRVIVLDHQHRVWMLRINDPYRPRWILPGGGVEEGETFVDAARRELWEECAINDAKPGPLVAVRDRPTIVDMKSTPAGMQKIAPRSIHSQERYFLVWLQEQQPGPGNMFDYEMADYTESGWFSAAEIRASHETFYPLGIADLLDTIARGEIPAEPWESMD